MMTDTHTRACYNGIGILLLVLQLLLNLLLVLDFLTGNFFPQLLQIGQDPKSNFWEFGALPFDTLLVAQITAPKH